MRCCLSLTLLVTLGYFLSVAALNAQTDANPQTASSGQETSNGKGENPPKGIIVIGSDKEDEFIKALKKEIKELKAKLREDKLRPYSCKLDAHIQDNIVHITANYIVKTFKDEQYVLLGCQGGQVRDVRLGGKVTFLKHTPSRGYSVLIPKEGKYSVTLELVVPLKATRQDELAGGTQYRFTLGLPGASVTNLELETPEAVKEVQVSKPANSTVEKKEGGRNWSITLGQAKEVELSWLQQPARPIPSAPVTANWEVTVELQEHKVITKAILKIDDRRGMASEWHLIAPKNAKLEIQGEPNRIQGEPNQNYTWQFDDKARYFVVTGPSTQHLEVTVTLTHKFPFKKLKVGPLLLLGANRQQGVFNIVANKDIMRVHHLRYDYTHGDLRPDDTTGKKALPDLEAKFKSWDLTAGLKPLLKTPKGRKNIPAPLELELRTIVPLVDAAVDHQIIVDKADGTVTITCASDIHVTPFKGGVDFIEVELPGFLSTERKLYWLGVGSSQAAFPGNLFDAIINLSRDELSPLQSVKDYSVQTQSEEFTPYLDFPDNSNLPRIILQPAKAGQRNTILTPFTVTLVRKYAVAPGISQARLPLPRPIALHDKGGTTAIEANDNLELILPDQLTSPAPVRQHNTDYKVAPRFVDLAWRVYQPEIPVKIMTDVTFQARHGLVQQEMTFNFAVHPKDKDGASFHEVTLVVPPSILDLKLISGGKLHPHLFTGTATVQMKSAGSLKLQYIFPLPDPEPPDQKENSADAKAETLQVDIPLIWPAKLPNTQHTVRLWTTQGVIPAIPGDVPENQLWRDQGILGSSGSKNSLPACAVHTEHPQAALTILLPATFAQTAGTVLVDRALVQVKLHDDGLQEYSTRYLVHRVNGSFLDIEFPAPVRQLDPSIYVQDKRVNWNETQVEGNVARIKIPQAMLGNPFLLTIAFQHAPDDSNFWKTSYASLGPPRLKGQLQIFNGVRWQIITPASYVSVLTGNYVLFPQQWSWQGWQLAPQARVSGEDLEKWLTAAAPETPIDGGLIVRTSRLHELQVLLVPRPIWLLCCSGILLVFGLGLTLPSRLRVFLWFLAGLLVPAFIVISMLWPSVFYAVLYGVQPGVVILVILFLVQWLLQLRYHRQVVFLPGFTRVKSKSSLVQPERVRPRAPSTVDAVPAAGSGLSSSATGKGGGS